MYVTPAARIADYENKGWWRGISVDALLRGRLDSEPAQLALIDPPNRGSLDGAEPHRIGWRELDDRVDRLAAAFYGLGLRKNDRIIAQLPNTIDAVITFLAAARLGLIISPVVMQYRQHEFEHIFKSVEPAAFVTVPRFHGFDHGAFGAKICAQHSVKLLLFARGGAIERSTRSVSLCDAMADADRKELKQYCRENPVKGGEVLTVCWTSGTEARPKGVPRTHNHWVLNGEIMKEATAINAGAIMLNPFPLVNIGSIGGLVMPWLLMGGTLVLHHPFDIEVFLQQVQEERVNYTIAPPALLGALLKQPERLGRYDLSSLQTIGSGSAPLSPSIIAGWRAQFGIETINIFGSNEGAAFFSSHNSVPDCSERARFFPNFGAEEAEWKGLTAEITRSRLVDLETGEDIAEPGKPGELLLEGAMIFDGYWRAPELNEASFDSQGFYKTGDLFEIAGPGNRYYQFHGRSKEIIVRGGVKISPAEVDDLIVSHPQIKEAATVGIPDDQLGERIAVAIVPIDGASITFDDIAQWMTDRAVAIFKRPEVVVIVDSLPRNAMNKVVREELREILLPLVFQGEHSCPKN